MELVYQQLQNLMQQDLVMGNQLHVAQLQIVAQLDGKENHSVELTEMFIGRIQYTVVYHQEHVIQIVYTKPTQMFIKIVSMDVKMDNV